MAAIAGVVSFELFDPILAIAAGHPGFAAAFVTVPETAVNHDYGAAAGKHEIWFSGQVFCVQAVAVAETVEKAADNHFGRGVLGSNAAHVF